MNCFFLSNNNIFNLFVNTQSNKRNLFLNYWCCKIKWSCYQRYTEATDRHLLSIFPVTPAVSSFSFIPYGLLPLRVSDETPLQILQQLFLSMLNVRINSLHSSGHALLVNQLPQQNCVSFPVAYLSFFPAQSHLKTFLRPLTTVPAFMERRHCSAAVSRHTRPSK